MKKVRVGIIGIGSMGSEYVLKFMNGLVENAELTAVCTKNKDKIEWINTINHNKIKTYEEAEDFFSSGIIDAVIIARTHYDHPSLAKKAFDYNLHVLIEKPSGVYAKNVLEMNQKAIDSHLSFSIMYNQRMHGIYQKARNIILSGELGEIKRTNWIVTHWYRPQSYYDSSDWRATWSGEGGGVLLNQAPHQLDLWQWMTGMLPKHLQAFNFCGKYHNIEVEDESTIFAIYENGATGVFITSTGETPGTNRFEIIGDYGKLVLEDEKFFFYKLQQSERNFNSTHKEGMGEPESHKIEVPYTSSQDGHLGIIQNWVNNIFQDEELIAPGEEGINGLQISNAAYLSSWLGKMVEVPVDPDLFYEKLKEKVDKSNKNSGL